MRKFITFFVIAVPVGLVSFFMLYITQSESLELHQLGRDSESKSVVAVLGNVGMADVTIVDVVVNGGKKPLDAKVQIDHPHKGFVVVDAFDSEHVESYNFVELEGAVVPKNSPSNLYINDDYKTLPKEAKNTELRS
jgi:hypothetical protein